MCSPTALSVSLPDGDSLQGNDAYGRGYSVGFRESEPGSGSQCGSFSAGCLSTSNLTSLGLFPILQNGDTAHLPQGPPGTNFILEKHLAPRWLMVSRQQIVTVTLPCSLVCNTGLRLSPWSTRRMKATDSTRRGSGMTSCQSVG